jgi:diguanylate cyclase (GGDEF)-like protein
MLAALLRDRFFQFALGAIGLLGLPYLLPLFPAAGLPAYANHFTNLALILLTIAAFQYRLGRVASASERRFWGLWTAAFVMWLAQDRLLNLARDGQRPALLLAQDALLVGFYAWIAVAIHARPDLPTQRSGWPRRIEVAGTLVFMFGLLGYLSVIPFFEDGALLATDVPSLVLYVILDSLICLKLAWALRHAAGPRWRVLYAWLLAASALFLLTDGIEVFMYVSIVPWRPSGSLSDLVWWLPFVPLVAAARLREHAFAEPSRPHAVPPEPPAGEQLWGDPLVAYAVAFPLMHFALYGVGALDPATRPVREAFALSMLALLAGLVVAYQKLLLVENRRLGELRLRAAQAEHRAYHDALTGLPNRYLLFDRLEGALARARRAKARLAVLFLDLDNFKVVNDSLGHTAGDRLLGEVARRLGRDVRRGDTLARLGGDEFTLLAEAVHAPEDAVKIALKLREALREPFALEGRELFVTASMGIALHPDDGEDAEALLKNSDVAMYRAKEHGGDGHQLYQHEMNARAEERLALESSLRRAAGLGQFALQYQPIIEVASGRAIGCEALLRWRHPERGLLLPADFIELAELTGVIMGLGPWILRSACGQARDWDRDSMQLSVAVNLSPRQFLDSDLPRRVEVVLNETGLPSQRLELEFTESLAVRDVDATVATLRALRKLGVRLSIDDFGTGYSSLAYLKQLPIDTLKIDRALVRDIDRDRSGATIAAAILAMARALGMRVVAEGVEDEAQLRVLRDLGCDCAQGYLLGRPAWPEQLRLGAPAPRA